MSHSLNRTEPIDVSICVDPSSGHQVIAGANSSQSSGFGNAANILAMSDDFTRSKARFASSSSSVAPRTSEQSSLSSSSISSSAQQQQGQQRAAEGQAPARSATQLQHAPLERLATEELLQRLQVIGNAIVTAQTVQEREKFISEGRQTTAMLALYTKQQRAMIDNPNQFMSRTDAGIVDRMSLDEQMRLLEKLESRYVNTLNTEEQINLYQRMYIVSESIREIQTAAQKSSSRTATATAPSSSSRSAAREEDIVNSFSRMSVNNKNNAAPIQSRGNELNDADYGGQRIDARMVNADNNNNAYDQRYQSSNNPHPYSGYGQGNNSSNNGNSANSGNNNNYSHYRGGNNYGNNGNNGNNHYGRNNY